MTHIPPQPRIAISGASAESASFQAMVKRVSEAGGSPLLIDNHVSRMADEDVTQVSGLVIMGNDFDIDPIHYMGRYPEGDPRKKIHPATRSELDCQRAAARAKYENRILQVALNKKMPILCICGGMQRLNVLCGGTLHQHVPDLTGHDNLMQGQLGLGGDTATIPIVIEPATRMSIIARKIQMNFVKAKTPGLPTVIMENSFRHQSIDMVGEGLRVCALSDTVRMPDGTTRYLIEAIEATPEGPYGQQFLIGVQWHPEFCASRIGRELVKDFIRHALAYGV